MTELKIGVVDVPAEWEIRSDTVLLEPSTAVQVPLSGRPAGPAPRSNIVIGRLPATITEPEKRLDILLHELAEQVPNLKVIDRGELTFADATVAPYVTLSIPATAEITVLQHHVLRIDGETETHIATTVGMGQQDKLQRLLEVVRSFRPSPEPA